ncbi:phage tail tip protein, partial [Aeromonas caviae]
ALGRRVDTVQAEVTSQGSNLAAGLQSEQEARVTADAALAKRVDTVQAKANEVSSAVQTVAEAHAGLNNAVEAGWYTKAQINGEGGGFGLSVKLAADGSTLTSFVIDADVFAVLSRASGVTSKRNPFVIKNGITYLNKAMMDSADINSLVAAYISVTELVGLNIKGSSISGTNIIGGSLNIGAGKAIINSAGKATLQDADIIGKITALSGVLRNVTIEDTCKINGTLEAGQIVGDIVRVYDASNQAQINLGAVNFAREISFSIIVNSGREKTTGNAILNGTTVKTVTSTAIDVAGTISANTVSAAHVVTLPAGVSHTARFSWSGNGGYNSAYCLVIVSKK